MHRSLVMVSLGLGSAACPSASTEEMPVEIPEAVQRAFDGSCAEAECHDATTRAGGLALDAVSSAAIVGGPSSQSELPLVTVGSLSESYMAVKLLPDDQLPAGVERYQEPMPLGGYGEGDVDDVNVILSWIAGYGPSGGDDSAASGTGTGEASGSGTGEGGTTGGDGGSTNGDGPVDDDGGPSYPRCSVEGVTAGEVSSPLDKGDEAGRFPVVVAEALEGNCGCHTLANRNLNTELPGLLAPGGTLFLEYADMSRPVGGTTLGLLMEEATFGNFSMPPGSCPAMSSDDTAVLLAWFEQDLPDGAGYVPP